MPVRPTPVSHPVPASLRKMGYEVDFNPNHKYPTIKMPHDRRAVRFKTLGEEYTPQAMAQRIQQNHEIGDFSNAWRSTTSGIRQCIPITRSCVKTSARPSWRHSASTAPTCITAICWASCPPQHPTTAHLIQPMREDYRRWAEIEKQLHLLEQHSLNTAEGRSCFYVGAREETDRSGNPAHQVPQTVCAAAATRPSARAPPHGKG